MPLCWGRWCFTVSWHHVLDPEETIFVHVSGDCTAEMQTCMCGNRLTCVLWHRVCVFATNANVLACILPTTQQHVVRHLSCKVSLNKEEAGEFTTKVTGAKKHQRLEIKTNKNKIKQHEKHRYIAQIHQKADMSVQTMLRPLLPH